MDRGEDEDNNTRSVRPHHRTDRKMTLSHNEDEDEDVDSEDVDVADGRVR